MAKKIMFQGTGSSVGKSIVVTAMCRILSDKGYNVAPFKSQNMALNSFVTEEGLEMGRAQVVQAEAARIKPTVHMNPILLKPTSDVGSQVIVNGKVKANMKAQVYFSKKNELIPEIKKAFHTLEKEYDVIVIEGAGSPAEINLRSRDVVNMGLAEMVDTDVVLIGDVDRGGVFAAIYGTYALLEPSEKERVKGFVINKFRGDVSLLMPGVEMLEQLIPIKCLGVLPYVTDINIDDEDSVSDRLINQTHNNINIGVIRLPFMSNFSDFTCFEMHDDVALKYIKTPNELETCDLIIIPGSKNTLFDMKFLIDSGFSKAIYKAHRKGVPIVGICGGYQMLGQTISDPFAVESELDTINGLGLLNVNTTMFSDKTTVQSSGTILEPFMGLELVGASVTGYEIHMGKTTALSDEIKAFAITDDNRPDGHISPCGNVVGTYFHGIFDNDTLRNAVLNRLRVDKGLDVREDAEAFETFKEQAYDRLASCIEPCLNWSLIEQILESSRPTP